MEKTKEVTRWTAAFQDSFENCTHLWSINCYSQDSCQEPGLNAAAICGEPKGAELAKGMIEACLHLSSAPSTYGPYWTVPQVS